MNFNHILCFQIYFVTICYAVKILNITRVTFNDFENLKNGSSQISSQPHVKLNNSDVEVIEKLRINNKEEL